MDDAPYVQPESSGANSVGAVSWSARFVEGVVLLSICWFLVQILSPAIQSDGGASPRTYCKNYLKQIGLALYNYHDEYDSFPPAYTVDEHGRPLHSWRTLILPYIDQSDLYSQIDLTKPWNDPTNKQAMETQLHVFQCPSASVEPNHTTYLASNGEQQAFHNNATRQIRAFADGPANTLMVAEVPSAFSVPWMSPQDADESLLNRIRADESTTHAGGFQMLFCEGSVRFIECDIDEATFQALLTIDGGDVAGEY